MYVTVNFTVDANGKRVSMITIGFGTTDRSFNRINGKVPQKGQQLFLVVFHASNTGQSYLATCEATAVSLIKSLARILVRWKTWNTWNRQRGAVTAIVKYARRSHVWHKSRDSISLGDGLGRLREWARVNTPRTKLPIMSTYYLPGWALAVWCQDRRYTSQTESQSSCTQVLLNCNMRSLKTGHFLFNESDVIRPSRWWRGHAYTHKCARAHVHRHNQCNMHAV